MRKTFLVSFVAVALAGCASEQEICQNKATYSYRMLEKDIASVEENISRGYDTKSTRVPYEEKDICEEVVRDSHTGQKMEITHVCTKVKYRTVEEKVPINIEYERERLAAMRLRLDQERKFAESRLNQCAAF